MEWRVIGPYLNRRCFIVPIQQYRPVKFVFEKNMHDEKENNRMDEMTMNGLDKVLKSLDDTIRDIETNHPVKINFYNERCTHVKFLNGTEQKAVVQPGDVFDRRSGIAMCLIYQKFGGKNKFYKALKQAEKLYAAQQKREKLAKQAEEEAAARREKMIAKAKARKEAAEKKQIAIQKEAYLQAMKELQE